MKKLRIGIIGAGWWATFNHMPELAARPDVELAAVCRLGKESLGDPREVRDPVRDRGLP
jgi:predicted dehydrogenase